MRSRLGITTPFWLGVVVLLLYTPFYSVAPQDGALRNSESVNTIEKEEIEQMRGQLHEQIILESIRSYPGICPCPYSKNLYGAPCEAQSPYYTLSDYKLLCYREDIGLEDMMSYLDRQIAQLLPQQSDEVLPYSRELYLSNERWSDADGDCQDTRQEVLIIESLQETELTADGCRVLSGLWYDSYSNSYFTEADKLDVDHFIPLKEAHISGAHLWDNEERRAFANNIDNPHLLIAVSAKTNRSKGAKDPARWLPPNQSFHCEYIRRWKALKERYSLSYDELELRTIHGMQRRCE